MGLGIGNWDKGLMIRIGLGIWIGDTDWELGVIIGDRDW